MNGCACILEDIVMHDREVLPSRSEVDEVIPLQFIPTALLLRAEDAKWTLPPEQLPPLPESVSRRGLFLLRPHTAYFTHEKLHVKRVQFPVFDASVRIVYGAQGEDFKAVVADLERPHDMSADLFWLACYVMISRAQSLDGLLFTRLCARTALERGAPKYLLNEVDRLLEIEKIGKGPTQSIFAKTMHRFADGHSQFILSWRNHVARTGRRGASSTSGWISQLYLNNHLEMLPQIPKSTRHLHRLCKMCRILKHYKARTI